MRILITGGAGFVGSALSLHFKRAQPNCAVVVFDNLRRRGSEFNLPKLAAAGVEFVHGDVRNTSDFESLSGNFDVLIEASAEPSVLAGTTGSPRYVLDTNLGGAIACLEFARARCASVIFLSSSRVYSIEPLRTLPLVAGPSGFGLTASSVAIPGATSAGISEAFPTDGYRSYYGASKLAAELMCQEYAFQAKLPIVINRCGVIAGPGQFGKTDQGVFTLWVARHHFGRALKYTGFGGEGLQVRDLLHPADLCKLIEVQLASIGALSGEVFNIGGGHDGSVSLLEYTRFCEEAVGRSTTIDHDPTTNEMDIPWYVTDHAKATNRLGWQPNLRPQQIVADIAAWVRANEHTLASIIA